MSTNEASLSLQDFLQDCDRKERRNTSSKAYYERNKERLRKQARERAKRCRDERAVLESAQERTERLERRRVVDALYRRTNRITINNRAWARYNKNATRLEPMDLKGHDSDENHTVGF